jgi:aldehyde:ferredoxin oxidoreductase
MLPDRFYEEALPSGAVIDRGKYEEMLSAYYLLRGYDKDTGTPTEEKLRSLGLDDVADDLKSRGIIP